MSLNNLPSAHGELSYETVTTGCVHSELRNAVVSVRVLWLSTPCPRGVTRTTAFHSLPQGCDEDYGFPLPAQGV